MAQRIYPAIDKTRIRLVYDSCNLIEIREYSIHSKEIGSHTVLVTRIEYDSELNVTRILPQTGGHPLVAEDIA